MLVLTRRSITSSNHTSLSAEHKDGLTIIGLSAATQKAIFIDRKQQSDEMELP